MPNIKNTINDQKSPIPEEGVWRWHRQTDTDRHTDDMAGRLYDPLGPVGEKGYIRRPNNLLHFFYNKN